MATIPLKSIQFPGLDDIYTVTQLSQDLATAGEAADSSVTGNAINALAATMPTIDNTLSIEGDAADSKATGDAIGEVEDAVDYVRGETLDYESIPFTEGTYIRNDTAIGGTVDTTQVSSGLYMSIKQACKKGQRFIITVNGGAAARGWSFVDSSSKQVAVAPDDTNYTNQLLTAPCDGYILVNNKNAQTNPLFKAEYNKEKADITEIQATVDEIDVVSNIIYGLSYTDGSYYSTGYGNTASNASCSILPYLELEPNTTYCIRSPYLSFTWLKNGAEAGVLLTTLNSYTDNGDGTYCFTTWNTSNVIKLYITVLTASKGRAYLIKGDYIPDGAASEKIVVIPNLALKEAKGVTLFVSQSYTSSTPGYGVTRFDNVIDAVNSITDASATKPYTVIIEAGTAQTPIVYDDWNTVYAGHVSDDAGYVGIQIPSYVTITTTQPTHPERTVLYFDGHAGISDTMTYNDAYKKCLFHINGKKMGIIVEGVTLRSKDCRYAFHPESGVDGYGVEWTLKNCIIDWQGCPHSSETGWAGVTAVGVGLGYGGTGHFENCKWLTVTGVTTAIGGHTNGWNPGVSTLPIMPGATITMRNCDFGGYNVFMTNSTATNELNNVLDFYNVVNCSGNDSTGWVDVKNATIFTD